MTRAARRDRIRVLTDASRSLVSSLDLSTTLPLVARAIADHIATSCVVEVERADGESPWRIAAHRDSAASDRISEPSSADGDRRLVIPLSVRGELLGRLIVASDNGPLDDAAVLLRDLAIRVSLAIDNSRLYQRERRMAQMLQEALLPAQLPQSPGYSYRAVYSPAGPGAEVGGDWYDAFPLPDGRVAVSIGDVAGHGLDAAVVMGEVRQTLRVAAIHREDPAAVLDLANDLLMSRPDPIMVTAVFGIFDGKEFTYATAGHPPPLVCTHDGVVEQIPAGGVPLGIDSGVERSPWTISLPPGSLLLLYTDGLIEHSRDVLDGERILERAVTQIWSLRPADPAEAVRVAVLGDSPNRDDVAILSLAADDRPVERIDLRYSATPVAASLVRHALAQFAVDQGLDQDRSYALRLAVGEAVNNAIEHAYAQGRGMFRVTAERRGDAIDVCVVDEGTWRPARDEGRGFGLPIIRALMQSFEVNLTSRGTSVSFSLALGDDRRLAMHA